VLLKLEQAVDKCVDNSHELFFQSIIKCLENTLTVCFNLKKIIRGSFFIILNQCGKRFSNDCFCCYSLWLFASI